MCAKPSPLTWTLRFKHNTTTILLHVDPLQRLSSVKGELLKALQQSHRDGRLSSGATIPSNAADILLAKPKYIDGLASGYESVEPPLGEADEDNGKGKTAVAATTTGKKASATKGSAKDSAQAVGFRDGGIVAFKFRTGKEEWVDEEGAEIRVDEEDDEEWDVVVPTVEDTYGDLLIPVDEGIGEDGG